jgi:DNA-binding NarL/FixJ family response regulator
MKPVNILIVDDHEVVRRSLRLLLENDPRWMICAEAATGAEAVESVKRMIPDIVLVDLVMPDLNGLEVTRQILRHAPVMPIIILTMHDSDELWDEACRIGARGVILKSKAGEALVNAIDRALRPER